MYLSIDLDYFFINLDDIDVEVNRLRKIIRMTGTDDIALVESHDDILPHIEAVKPSEILHIDYHQDIAFPTPRSPIANLNEGTFFILSRIGRI